MGVAISPSPSMNFLFVLPVLIGVVYSSNAPEILTAIGENVAGDGAAEYRFLFKTITKVVTSTSTSTTTSSQWNSCYTSAGALTTCITRKKKQLDELVDQKPIFSRNGRPVDEKLIRPSKAATEEVPEGRINAASDEFREEVAASDEFREEVAASDEVVGIGSKNLAEGRLNFFKVYTTSTYWSVSSSTTT